MPTPTPQEVANDTIFAYLAHATDRAAHPLLSEVSFSAAAVRTMLTTAIASERSERRTATRQRPYLTPEHVKEIADDYTHEGSSAEDDIDVWAFDVAAQVNSGAERIRTWE